MTRARSREARRADAALGSFEWVLLCAALDCTMIPVSGAPGWVSLGTEDATADAASVPACIQWTQRQGVPSRAAVERLRPTFQPGVYGQGCSTLLQHMLSYS